MAGTVSRGMDDNTRKKIRRRIQIGRVLINILAVLLALGVIYGIAFHDWPLTLSGVVLNLLAIYLIRRRIQRLQQNLGT